MSTFKIDEFRRDARTLNMSAAQYFSSSSSGVTGSLPLAARPSKNLRDLVSYETTGFRDESAVNYTREIALQASASRAAGSTDISQLIDSYVSSSKSLSRADQRSTVVFSPKLFCFDPAVASFATGSDYSMRSAAKRFISGTLVPFYSPNNQGKYLAAGNYFSLNFFTSSAVPSDTALVFPDFVLPYSYTFSRGLTIDLHINPRYTTDEEGAGFRAGVIAQSPGNYCLSLVTGSNTGGDGRPSGYRLVLALSHSADVTPSSIDLSVANGSRAFPQDLIYVSDDNSLNRNAWHHVSVGWSPLHNNGTGSFFIDGVEKGIFSLSSSSFAGTASPGCLVVGNYLLSSADGSQFFNSAAAADEGIVENLAFASGDPTPGFSHPLNAEIHSLKVYRRYINQLEREANAASDSALPEPDLVFYMPPYFLHESPTRRVPVSLDTKVSKTTTAVLNRDLMFSCGGRDVNLESFARNVAKFGLDTAYPRLYNLTASLSGVDTSADFNSGFYGIASNRKRNLTALPCDDGTFRLTYSSLASIPATTGSMLSRKGALDYSTLSMTGLTNEYPATSPIVVSTTNNNPTGQAPTDEATGGGYYSTQYFTQDTFLLFGTLIDLPMMTYGHKVADKSFQVIDNAITGSGDKVRISFRDDGKNGLYRADASTQLATWNTQGLLFNNEGVGILLAPTVPFYAKHGWTCEYQTDASAHVFSMDVVIPAGAANVSQNKTYSRFPPTNRADERANDFVYIDTINVHDENLNVIARAALAQPFLKRPDESVVFRVKLDF
jgi:hypothetical protein